MDASAYSTPQLKKGILSDLYECSVTQNMTLTLINFDHSIRLWEICMVAIGIQFPWFYRFH